MMSALMLTSPVERHVGTTTCMLSPSKDSWKPSGSSFAATSPGVSTLPRRRSSQLRATSISAFFSGTGYWSASPVTCISGYSSRNSCMDRSKA